MSVGSSGSSAPPQSAGAPGREPSGPTRPAAPAYSRRRTLRLIGGLLGLAAGAAVVDTLGGPGTISTARVVRYPRIDSLATSSVFHVFAGDQEIWTEEFARTRTIHVANFAATGRVPIRIEVDKTVRSVQVSPKHRGPSPWWHGTTVRFTVDGDGPRKLIVFVRTSDGRRDPLYLLVGARNYAHSP